MAKNTTKAATKKTATKAAKAKAKTATAAKATTKAKAAKAKADAPTVTEQRDARVITLVDKDFTFGGEGTIRNKCWEAFKAALTKGKTTVAEYKAKGGAVKYLPRWEAKGAIKIAA